MKHAVVFHLSVIVFYFIPSVLGRCKETLNEVEQAFLDTHNQLRQLQKVLTQGGAKLTQRICVKSKFVLC